MRPYRTPKQLLIEAQAEIEEFRINAATEDEDGTTSLTRGQCADLASLIEALAEHVERDAEPVAWLWRPKGATNWIMYFPERWTPPTDGTCETMPTYATAGAAKAAAPLRQAATDARRLLDEALGDTDPADPDHPIPRACQVLSAALDDDDDEDTRDWRGHCPKCGRYPEGDHECAASQEEPK